MSPLRRYRLLLIVAGLTACSYWWDLNDPDNQAPRPSPRRQDRPDPYLIQRAIEKKRLDDTLMALYPNRPEILLQQGLLAERMGRDDLARDFFERAIATGEISNEELHYEYAVVLIRLKAPQEEIDAAAENWRRLFPLSKIPDPRTIQAENVVTAPREKMWVGDSPIP